jgi:molybdopterin/thiamine biosynthesis adenylyltransferase
MNARRRVLIVGLGGLGCPVAAVLAQTPGIELWLADDDVIELSNLHRQLLYAERDVGQHKLPAAARALVAQGASADAIVERRTRLLPGNARQLVREVDLVVEGADNYATKFLAADAAHLERRPIVHGAAVRWVATAWAVSAEGAPCYRCLFEDVPAGAQQGCSEAGVMGPVVGFAGALMAELALRVLSSDASAFGALFTYDGRRDLLRRVPASPRSACPLCGAGLPRIADVSYERYVKGHCAA